MITKYEHGVFSQDRWMYFFDHPDKPKLTAATFDSESRNLPDFGSGAHWKPVGSLIIGPANRPWVVAMEAGLRTNGYYLRSDCERPLDDKNIKAAVQGLVKKTDYIMG